MAAIKGLDESGNYVNLQFDAGNISFSHGDFSSKNVLWALIELKNTQKVLLKNVAYLARFWNEAMTTPTTSTATPALSAVKPVTGIGDNNFMAGTNLVNVGRQLGLEFYQSGLNAKTRVIFGGTSPVSVYDNGTIKYVAEGDAAGKAKSVVGTLSITQGGVVTQYDGSANKSITIAATTSVKPLTISVDGASTVYDGSVQKAVNITIPKVTIPDQKTLTITSGSTKVIYNGKTDQSITIPAPPPAKVNKNLIIKTGNLTSTYNGDNEVTIETLNSAEVRNINELIEKIKSIVLVPGAV